MRWTDGNMTQDGVYTYTYDAENRLICVAPTTPATGSEKVESVYDYMGRRVQKTVTAWDGSIGTGGDWATTPESITRFVYDGWNVVLELNGLVFDNVATAWDERVSRKYTWGLDLSGLSGNPTVSGIHGAGGIGGLLATAVQVGSSSIGHVYFYDGNGNVGQTLNIGNDTLTARYEYDPYGNLVSILGGPFRNRNPFRFSTKYFDRELDLHGTNDGLYYYGYRFYSARLGRWVTRDPIGEAGGDNLYGFADNVPVQSVDGLGLSPKAIPLPKEPGGPTWVIPDESAALHKAHIEVWVSAINWYLRNARKLRDCRERFGDGWYLDVVTNTRFKRSYYSKLFGNRWSGSLEASESFEIEYEKVSVKITEGTRVWVEGRIGTYSVVTVIFERFRCCCGDTAERNRTCKGFEEYPVGISRTMWMNKWDSLRVHHRDTWIDVSGSIDLPYVEWDRDS